MKRIAAIVVALVLMVGLVTTAYAADKISDVYLNSMKSLYNTYQKTPDVFGEEAIVIAYCNYQMYENAKLMEMMETNLKFSVSLLGDQLKPIASAFTTMTEIVSNEFKKWLNGETSNEEFLTLVMNLYKTAIESKEE